ncbi:RNA polymerase sigma-70 factor (ECF subfamily) [Arthrobacter pigmenti]|uniref:RNA polymerase sigma-70 factor (ECF subfamily) n=2 Tax=Arthrobacter pigmenti TaxID=271432 RepID=A0A846RNA9_9MICC|nr:RNA polymerase sigma-70 factor (ECF subfamily) [Arthrobacter pigmenti]
MRTEPDSDIVAIHTRNYQRVLAYILRRVNDREAAQELAADVFRIAWQRERGADTGIGWLLGVARNVIGNEYRGRRRARELELKLQDGMRAQLHGHPDPRRDLVANALGKVSAKHREVLILAYWDDLNTAELAQVLGCSQSNAGVRLHRARAALAQVLPSAADPGNGV